MAALRFFPSHKEEFERRSSFVLAGLPVNFPACLPACLAACLLARLLVSLLMGLAIDRSIHSPLVGPLGSSVAPKSRSEISLGTAGIL